jgi:hypothetical protein
MGGVGGIGATQRSWWRRALLAVMLKKLWRSYPFTQVKRWGVINEPDLHKKQTTYATAAKTWRAVKTASVTKDPNTGSEWCPGCQIAAGEFAWNSPSTGAFALNYIDSFKGTNGWHPHFWALHAYPDVVYQEYHAKDSGYPTLTSMEKRIVHDLGKRQQIWLSEQGVVLRRVKDRPTAINGHTSQQLEDARRFRHLMGVVNETTMVNYYEFFGDLNKFDSGLVEPVQPRDPLGRTAQFRVTYCELAYRFSTQCTAQGYATGTNPNSP